jgi:hypothetical protein
MAPVVGELRSVVAELLRRLLDFVEGVAVDGIEQHVFKQSAIEARRVSADVIAIRLNDCVDNPDFVTWLQATVKR